MESHRTKKYPNAFTARYNADKLVWFQEFESIIDARTREKQLKAGNRARKIKLIEEINSECLPDCLSSNRMMPFGRSGGERLIRNIVKCRGHETTSVVPPSWSPAPNKLRSRNNPGQNKLISTILRGSTATAANNFRGTTSQVQTTFVVRVCEGDFLPERNGGKKTTAAAPRILALK